MDAVNTEVQQAGAWVFGGGVHPSDRATVVRARDGEVLATDGPYAESKEQLSLASGVERGHLARRREQAAGD